MQKFTKKILALMLSVAVLLPMFQINIAWAAEIKNWKFEAMGGCIAEAEVVVDEKYSGQGSVKVVNSSPAVGNVYCMLTQTVNVEEGKTYYVGSKIKAKNATTIHYCVDWGKRYDITSYGTTFDWTNVQFLYEAEATATVTWRLLMEGTCAGIWIDDCVFIDIETGENLLQNPGFDGSVAASTVKLDSNSAEVAYSNIMSSDKFSAEDVEKARAALKYIPVYEAKNIALDGNLDDWSDYPAIEMPALSNQYQIYTESANLDIKATYKFAYDDKYLYILANVTDDDHQFVDGGNYWTGDSIQFATGSRTSTYGTEWGIACNPKTQSCFVTGITRTDNSNVANFAKREGNKTIYEVAVPWDAFFSQRPSYVYMSAGINDNDGGQRLYCMEMAPGIAEGKTNAVFPLLEMIEGTPDFETWVQGNTKWCYEGDTVTFDYFVVNKADTERSFTITSETGTEKVSIPANSGIRKTTSKKYEELGYLPYTIKVECDGVVKENYADVTVEKALPTNQYATELSKKSAKYATEIKKLIDKCTEKGIATDYEMVSYRILERYEQFILDDIKYNDLTRVYYTEEALENLYTEAKANLEAYLAGEKEPLLVPRYVPGDTFIKGSTLYGNTEYYDGTTEVRPIFPTGYMAGTWMAKDISTLSEWGANANEQEIPLNGAMNHIKAWGMAFFGTPKYVVSADKDVKRSGEHSMKLEFTSPKSANQYLQINQHIYNIEPSTTYILKGFAKGDNSGGMNISATGWDGRGWTEIPSGTYDWTPFEKEFTTSDTATSLWIMMILESPNTAIYLDDLEIIHKETGENILINGGFENVESGELPTYDENSADVQSAIQNIKTAAADGQMISLLLGCHYFPENLIKEYDMAHTGSGFLAFNPNAPEARAIVENFIRGVITTFKDYGDYIKSVELSNEPQIWFHQCGDFYKEDWSNFLSERYGTIEELNKSHQSSWKSFDEVSMNPDYSNPAQIYDYITFNNIIYSEWHNWAADIVHEVWPEAKVGAKIMGYTRDEQSQNLLGMGTNLAYINDSFDLNTCDYWDYYEDGVLPLVGEMWYDYMLSNKTAPIFNTEDHIIADASGNFELAHAPHVGRNIYMGAIHGRAFSAQWMWGRENSSNKSSWSYGMIPYRPDAIYQNAKAAFDINRLSFEIEALQNEPVDVGILYSDASMFADNTAMHAAYRAYEAVLFNGKNVRFVIDTKAPTMHNYDLLIIPNQVYVKENTVSEIKKFIENGGHVIIMGENSLSKTEKNLDNDLQTVKYILDNSKVLPYEGKNKEMLSYTKEQLSDTIREALEEADVNYAELTDSETGEIVHDVEYNMAIYNGKVILNLCNYAKTTQNVKVSINGKPVLKAKERRSETEMGEVISLNWNEPVTLEIETDNPFFDTYSHWSDEEVSELYNKGLVKGVSASRFNPDSNITRAEFLALVTRSMGLEEVKYNGEIADVNADKWYANTVAAALSKGLIASESFRPDEAITREEMAVLLAKACELMAIDTEAKAPDFEDAEKISNKAAVELVSALEIVKGYEDGTFRPGGLATRSEASAMVNRFDNLKIGE